MKRVPFPATAALALLCVLVWPASEGWAGVHQDRLRTGGHLGWHPGVPGKKHPNKAMSAAMIVDQNFVNSDGVYSFCVTYTRWQGVNKPDKGVLKATIEIIRSNGEKQKIAIGSAKVSDHYAERCTPYVLSPLNLGDVVLFRFRFNKMPPFNEQSGRASYYGWVSSATAPWLRDSAKP